MNQTPQTTSGIVDLTLPLICAPHVLPTTDERVIRMMQAIRTETELLRERLRDDPFWGSPVFMPPQGLPKKTPERPRTIADHLEWPSLLSLKDCAARVSNSIGVSSEELTKFVITICPYEHLVQLTLFISLQASIFGTAKLLSPVIQPLKAKEKRLKQGAQIGGIKSGITRAKTAKTPPVEVLLKEAELLMQAGNAPFESTSLS